MNGPGVRFTAEEDALLIDLKERQALGWKEIKAHFPTRTKGTLQVRYCRSLNTGKKRDLPGRPRAAAEQTRKGNPSLMSSPVGRGHLQRAAKEKNMIVDVESDADLTEELVEDLQKMSTPTAAAEKEASTVEAPKVSASKEIEMKMEKADTLSPEATPLRSGSKRKSLEDTPSRPDKKRKIASPAIDRTPLARATKKLRPSTPAQNKTSPVTRSKSTPVALPPTAVQEPAKPQTPVLADTSTEPPAQSPARSEPEDLGASKPGVETSKWTETGPVSRTSPPLRDEGRLVNGQPAEGPIPEIFFNPPPWTVVEKSASGKSYRIRHSGLFMTKLKLGMEQDFSVYGPMYAGKESAIRSTLSSSPPTTSASSRKTSGNDSSSAMGSRDQPSGSATPSPANTTSRVLRGSRSNPAMPVGARTSKNGKKERKSVST